MKLRQRLAMVLAAAMVVTAVPVTTMAASTNGMTQTVSMVAGKMLGVDKGETVKVEGKNYTVYNKDEHDAKLKVDFDTTLEKDTTFYLEAEDFAFTPEAFAAYDAQELSTNGVDLTQFNKETTTASAIRVNNAVYNKDGEVAGASIEVTYTEDGKESKEVKVLTRKELETAGFDVKAADSDLAIEVAAADKAGYKMEWLSESQIRVTVKKGKEDTQKVELPVIGLVKKGTPAIIIDALDSYATSGKVVLSGEVVTEKNLSVKFADAKNLTVDGGSIADLTIVEGVAGALNSDKEEARTFIVSLPQSSDLEFSAKQNLEVKGLRGLAGENVKVEAKIFENEDGEKDAKKLVLVVEKTGVTSSTGQIKISNIQVKPEGRYEAALGDVEVKVTGEAIEDTKAVVGKVTEFGVNLTVDEVAELVAGKTTKEVTVTLEEAVADTFDARHKAYFTIDGGVVNPATLTVKLNGTDVTSEYVEKDVNAKTGHLEGFELNFAGIKADKANKFTFTFKVQGEVANMSDVVLTGESRSFKEDVNVTVAKMTAPVTVEAEAMTVKVGLKGQQGGKITINEADKGMLKKGELKLTMDDASIKFANDDLKIETTGTMKVEVKSVKNNEIILNVKRESNEAGKLTISGFTFDVDRTVPEGTEDVVLSGEAISTIKDDTLTVKDFVVVGTPNTEDNNATNGLQKGTGIFKVGERKYTVNGEEKEMDAAPYIAKSNRVMVPVKYVSDVFGVNGKDVLFSKENGGTITIFAGTRVLQVVNGSNVALVNGVKVPMDEKVAIIDGRTYVPVGEMARLLNVEVEWSNETKTATFTNR